MFNGFFKKKIPLLEFGKTLFSLLILKGHIWMIDREKEGMKKIQDEIMLNSLSE